MCSCVCGRSARPRRRIPGMSDERASPWNGNETVSPRNGSALRAGVPGTSRQAPIRTKGPEYQGRLGRGRSILAGLQRASRRRGLLRHWAKRGFIGFWGVGTFPQPWWDSNVEGDQKLVEVLSERSIRVVDMSESLAHESEGCARGSPQRSFFSRVASPVAVDE